MRWFDKRFDEVQALLDEAKMILEELVEEQEVKLDNVPESLQETDRYYTMSERLEKFEELRETLDDLEFDVEQYHMGMGASTSNMP